MKPDDKRGGLEGSGDTRRSPCAPKDSLSSSALPARQLVDQWRETILKQFDFSVAGMHLLDSPRPSYEFYSKEEWHTRGIRQGLKIARTILEETLKVQPPALAALLDPAPPQEDLPAEAAKILRDHAWELYGEKSIIPAPPATKAEELDARVDGERLSEATGSTAKITNGDK